LVALLRLIPLQRYDYLQESRAISFYFVC